MTRYPDRISHAITMGSGLFGVPNMFTPGGLSQGIRVIFETYMNPTPENFRRLVEIMVYDASYVTDELSQQHSAGALAQREHLTNWLKGGSAGQGRSLHRRRGAEGQAGDQPGFDPDDPRPGRQDRADGGHAEDRQPDPQQPRRDPEPLQPLGPGRARRRVQRPGAGLRGPQAGRAVQPLDVGDFRIIVRNVEERDAVGQSIVRE